jgi:signal transduction histidine kinase
MAPEEFFAGSLDVFGGVSTPERLVFAAAREINARSVRAGRAASSVAAPVSVASAAQRDEILVSVAHDLQQPLTLIKGQMQLLQRQLARGQTLEPARLERGLGFVNAAVIRMRGMLEEILDNALEQAGRPLAVMLSRTDLVALTHQAASEHQLAFESHQFVVEAESSEVWAMVDAARVQRILDNLLSNAVKYSPAGGTVRIIVNTTTAQPRWVVIAVHDPGLGIPAADLPRVFERFHRGANVVGSIPGNGLGLAGVRQMVDLHHGSIDVESEEGHGSTFTVRLPLGNL